MFTNLFFYDGNSAENELVKGFLLLRVELGKLLYFRPEEGKWILDVLDISKLSALYHETEDRRI